MSVEAGQSAAFQATLLDNGNPIDLPSGSTWSWSTDDPTDQLAQGGGDGSTVKVTVSGDNQSRTELTVTASTADPTGEQQSGSVTVPITPGVQHTYTVNVAQIFPSPKGR